MKTYKVGDKVTIKKYEDIKNNYPRKTALLGIVYYQCGNEAFTERMSKYCGKTFEVERVLRDGKYALKGCEHYNFTPEMFAENNKEIHITVDGNKTIAVLKEGGKVVKRAEAKCNPEDKFDFETGADIALDRLFGREVVKECSSKIDGRTTAQTIIDDLPKIPRMNINFKVVKEVKRRAKVGEYIKIVNPNGGEPYKVGDIFKVKEPFLDRGIRAYCRGCGNTGSYGYHVIYHHEYVVLENYEPQKEEEKPAFVPHLSSDTTNYGVIGEPTNYKDAIGRPLRIGDTVDVYSDEFYCHGEFAIVKKEDGKAFVMGIKDACDGDDGTTSDYKIIKKRSFEEIKDGESVGFIRYNKTEKVGD